MHLLSFTPTKLVQTMRPTIKKKKITAKTDYTIIKSSITYISIFSIFITPARKDQIIADQTESGLFAVKKLYGYA